jgi:hypothetical protein
MFLESSKIHLNVVIKSKIFLWMKILIFSRHLLCI